MSELFGLLNTKLAIVLGELERSDDEDKEAHAYLLGYATSLTDVIELILDEDKP